jgi:DNA primase
MFASTSVDLDEIALQLDRATRYENYIVALCPFHSEHRPSFFAYEDWYRCESCGANGPTRKLLDKLSSTIISSSAPVSFRNPFTRWLKERSLGETLKLAWKNGPSVYLRKRGINDEEQRKLGLGIIENYATFPIRSKRNAIVGAIARTISKESNQKYVIPSGQDPHLLYVPSWKRVEKRSTVYLTFGIIDAISLYLVGAAAISTTTGMKMNISYLTPLRKRIIFIPDQGEEAEAHKFASKMGWRGGVMRCNYPSGLKDPSDIIGSKHRDELINVLDLKDRK